MCPSWQLITRQRVKREFFSSEQQESEQPHDMAWTWLQAGPWVCYLSPSCGKDWAEIYCRVSGFGCGTEESICPSADRSFNSILLLILVVKPVTVLGTPRAAQLKTSQLPAKVFHFLCYDSSNKLKQPKSHWSLLLPASAAEVQKSCRGGTGRVAQGWWRLLTLASCRQQKQLCWVKHSAQHFRDGRGLFDFCPALCSGLWPQCPLVAGAH